MSSSKTTEYRIGFEIDPGSNEWYWCADVFYNMEEAAAKFNETVKHSNVRWSLRKDEIITTILKVKEAE